jgi:hypothetical protein
MVRIISTLILAVSAVCANAAEPLRLVDNPPDRHIVVQGDTLWGISKKFLQDAWRWPEVWRLNKEEIKNPHRIYPGDIVLLDRSGKEPRLTIAQPLRVEPKVHSTLLKQSLSSIPPNVIEPFISRPLVIDENDQLNTPRIVATQEDRVYISEGDTAFAKGISDASITKWQVFRPGKPLKDPETKEIIGHEAFFLGNAELVQPGDPAVIRIKTAKEEMGRGDRLYPAPPSNIVAYAPHSPEAKISGRVMSIYGGVDEAGKHAVVSINRGLNDNLEVGHVLALFRTRFSDGYDDNGKRISTAIPEERYALVFIFRVFQRVAYALVMETSKPVIVGDAVRNP